MFYKIYKTTNKINGKYYIGKHASGRIYDSYLGSGIALKAAVKKHGRENFDREILSIHPTEQDMNAEEARLITSEMLTSTQCYNIAPGGPGGRISKRQQDAQTRQFIDRRGSILEGRLCSIAWHTGVSCRKLSDLISGRRGTYRGLRYLPSMEAYGDMTSLS